MSDQWYFTHAGATHGPVSDVELLGLIETEGIAPDDLIWPVGVAPPHVIRSDAVLAFSTSVPVEPLHVEPRNAPPPECLPEEPMSWPLSQDYN